MFPETVMNRSLRWVSLFLLGIMLRPPIPGQAQAKPKNLADILGTWRYVYSDQSNKELHTGRDYAVLSRTLVFRPD